MSYCPIREAARADNQRNGHAQGCASGGGGDCTCGRNHAEDCPRYGKEMSAAYCTCGYDDYFG